MDRNDAVITRRDFLRGATIATAAAVVGLPHLNAEDVSSQARSRVVLIRDERAVLDDGELNAEVIEKMLNQAVAEFFGTETPLDAWKKIVRPSDVVGIKSNDWGPLPTPSEVENAIKRGVLSAGVPEENIDIRDRGVLGSKIFQSATALINSRPMRTHHWAGVGGLLKNYIQFTPNPPKYHNDSCADLAKLWELPAVKGRTRLNVLVMLTPLFHGIGPHHFDPEFVWSYKGLLVGTDPVAIDSVGVRILQAKRLAYFGEERPLKPPAHHVTFAEIRHKLGVSDPARIDLVKLGWTKDALI
jgi:hypothetical protein